MTTEQNTAQSIVDGQLAELQITSAEVTGATYKEQHDAKIAALAAEEAELPTPTDKASLQVVQDFITKSEKARTGIDKWRKDFKDQWKKIIDPVDAYIGTNKENGMQARIYAIQERAEAKKKAYLDEQAKAQREADRLLEERYQARFNKLIGAGMVVDATGNLTIRDGDQTLSALATQIRFATDEQMAAVLSKVEVIRSAQIEREEAARQAKEAEEREAQELKERLAKQQADQEAQAAKLKAEREAFEKERAEMRQAKNDTRVEDLLCIGATAWGEHIGVRGMHEFAIATLADHDADQWAQCKLWVREAAVKAMQEQKERERQESIRSDRCQELIELGADRYADETWRMSSDDNGLSVGHLEIGTMTSDEWSAVLARFKEAAEARGGALDMELVPDPNGPSEVWADPKEWATRIEADPEAGSVLTIPVGGISGPRPLQEGSAVAGEQPDLESGVVITQRHPDEIALEAYRDALLAVVHPCFDDLCIGASIDKIRMVRNVIQIELSE